MRLKSKRQSFAVLSSQVDTLANDNVPESDAQRVATYQAAMIVWHARQERARLSTLAYNKHVNRNAKRKPKRPAGSEPRETYKARYYEGGYRLLVDGIPTRLAAHVKDWHACNKAKLGTMPLADWLRVDLQTHKL